MLQRTASVNNVEMDSLAIASVFQIGDSNLIQGFSRAIAVQREVELFFDNEGNFANYPIFSEPLPLIPISETINMSRQNINPFIKVGNIDIIGVSSSSIVHLGNTNHVTLETRVKHIRQLSPKK
ncbi:spore germination protein GerPE [Mesobacillus maritimus]|uniref:Spore germination protein GerPE n=1 Tax=Mesobacillus maritimus TaxID=1643336 RepID=A0ABS7JZ68_9BACI|nr:spore germination protein GerPE [Mesobacillus maritimus]MBY0095290.1 spore germination protein GerPE [Mesobacillus maritimus]